MRKLTDHKLHGLNNTLNDALDIKVMDEPGHGGACRHYVIYEPHDAFNEELNAAMQQDIYFQNGPIQEHGVNGISGEALLAIGIDRLRGFQSGPYASQDNADALYHLETALECLQKRTKERLARGVEGNSIV